jgi:hypothetical protein
MITDTVLLTGKLGTGAKTDFWISAEACITLTTLVGITCLHIMRYFFNIVGMTFVDVMPYRLLSHSRCNDFWLFTHMCHVH